MLGFQTLNLIPVTTSFPEGGEGLRHHRRDLIVLRVITHNLESVEDVLSTGLKWWQYTWMGRVYTAEAVALGFQHYLVMLGSSVMIPSILVPMMGGNDVRDSHTIPYTLKAV